MRRWRLWLLIGILVWIFVVTWWALSPMSDSVPTGGAKNRDGVVVPTDQTVECPAPLSGSTNPREPLPVLRPASRSYQRTPCVLPHDNGRIIFAIDVLLVIGVLVVLIKTWKPSTEASTDEDPATARSTSAPSAPSTP